VSVGWPAVVVLGPQADLDDRLTTKNIIIV
jgi:hypothetical protein